MPGDHSIFKLTLELKRSDCRIEGAAKRIIVFHHAMTQKSQTEIEIILHITYEEYRRYYQGEVKAVVTKDIQGRTVQFPAHVLRPFIRHDGIHGCFTIYIDRDSRFIKMERK